MKSYILFIVFICSVFATSVCNHTEINDCISTIFGSDPFAVCACDFMSNDCVLPQHKKCDSVFDFAIKDNGVIIDQDSCSSITCMSGSASVCCSPIIHPDGNVSPVAAVCFCNNGRASCTCKLASDRLI